MQLKLVNKINETDNIVTFEWEPSEPLTWQAGQFIKYTLSHDNADDRGTSRWFTVAAPPFAGKPRITTRITADHGSTFKSALMALQVGATIEASRPSGDFTIDDTNRQLVLIAGGIGVTPYRAMLQQLDHDGHKITGRLLYANRNDQYAFKEEFESLAARHPNFAVRYFTDPTRLELEDIQVNARELENPLYYLSGPEPMVEHYKDVLVNAGITEENIKADYFPGYGTI